MKASEARERVIANTQIKQNKELSKIYEKINDAVEFGWHNTFISKFNISNDNKKYQREDKGIFFYKSDC